MPPLFLLKRGNWGQVFILLIFGRGSVRCAIARPLMIQYDGAVYHVTSRGNERKPVFLDASDDRGFLDVLRPVRERYNWLCHAYCLMTNHYHLVIETPDGQLSTGMRQLNGVYTQWFNRRHQRTGHLFQGRFGAMLVEKESHLLEACRYVILNPVRARVVGHPSEWEWSSYNSTQGRCASHPCLTTDWVLGQFAGKRSRARQEYRRFVEDGIGKESGWMEAKVQGVLGSAGFVEKLVDYVKGRKDLQEIPRSQRFLNRPSLETIFSMDVVETKRGRNRAMVIAVEEHGYSGREVADHLGLHYSTVSRCLSEEKAKGPAPPCSLRSCLSVRLPWPVFVRTRVLRW